LKRLDSSRPLPQDLAAEAALVARVTDQVAAVTAAAYNSSMPLYGQVTAGQVRPFVREATQKRLRQASDADAGVSPPAPLPGALSDGRPRGATVTVTSRETAYSVPGGDGHEAPAAAVPAPADDVAEASNVRDLDREQGGSCSSCVIA
jgi:hypothetical protein